MERELQEQIEALTASGHRIAGHRWLPGRKIRAHADPKAVKLIALPGFGSESDRQPALEAGFDFHLVKPVDFENLREVLVTVTSPRPP